MNQKAQREEKCYLMAPRSLAASFQFVQTTQFTFFPTFAYYVGRWQKPTSQDPGRVACTRLLVTKGGSIGRLLSKLRQEVNSGWDSAKGEKTQMD